MAIDLDWATAENISDSAEVLTWSLGKLQVSAHGLDHGDSEIPEMEGTENSKSLMVSFVDFVEQLPRDFSKLGRSVPLVDLSLLKVPLGLGLQKPTSLRSKDGKPLSRMLGTKCNRLAYDSCLSLVQGGMVLQ
jgi:hypothetical protein